MTSAAAGTAGSAGYLPATSEALTYNDRGQVLTAATLSSAVVAIPVTAPGGPTLVLCR